jgi:hypothetical protein
VWKDPKFWQPLKYCGKNMKKCGIDAAHRTASESVKIMKFQQVVLLQLNILSLITYLIEKYEEMQSTQLIEPHLNL